MRWILALCLGCALAGEARAMESVTMACTDDAHALAGALGTAWQVTCPSGCSKGTVYGSGPYSDDSKVCRAAIHAGAIPATGGAFVLTLAAGGATYTSTVAHGVTTTAAATKPRSFTIASAASTPSGLSGGTRSSSAPAPVPTAAATAGAAAATSTRGGTGPAPAPTTGPAPAPAPAPQSECSKLSSCCSVLQGSSPSLVTGCSAVVGAGVEAGCKSTSQSLRQALTTAAKVVPAVCQ